MVEIIRSVSSPNARAVLFDFDGTLSLVRTGWMEVMIPMMVEILVDLRTGESEVALRQVVEGFVWRLTGKETLYQMIALADEIRVRGGSPLDPLEYKRRFLDLLSEVISGRIDELRSGHCVPDKYMVPGARELLEGLRDRGLRLYLASGTDEIYMKAEADLIDVSRYFDGGVYGALDNPDSFSKRMLVHRIVAEIPGEQLIGFGDGYVEIEEVHQAGGIAVGVASDEPECRVPDEWKRQRLIGAGAAYIVPNYLEHDELTEKLFG